MLENAFQDRVAVKGSPDNPLALHLGSFARSLRDDGYADSTMRSKLWLLAGFGQWLERSGLLVTDVDERLVNMFVSDRQQERRLHRGDLETLRHFLDHLRRCDIIPAPKPVSDESPLADVLNRYERHLRLERGLVTATIVNYQPFVRNFLVERFGEGPFHLRQVRPSDISAFVLRHAHRMSPGRAQLMVTAFRSFFRFLFYNGDLETDLAASVPAVANWRLSTVPKYLIPKEVERVLGACDLRTSTGRRDYAILLLLARLGLRAGEVVALKLDDVDWKAGEIIVRGKGLVHDRMPLPTDVGEAVTSYLRMDRPVCRTRRVFVCTKAPRRGFGGPSTVTTIVRRALDRADLHPSTKGAHLLRHSLATAMLRSGATMVEIGEVLRHRLTNTTEIYAKIDFDGLRSLAHPWPSVGGGQ
jgi:integrase/recombinase XerD